MAQGNDIVRQIMGRFRGAAPEGAVVWLLTEMAVEAASRGEVGLYLSDVALQSLVYVVKKHGFCTQCAHCRGRKKR